MLKYMSSYLDSFNLLLNINLSLLKNICFMFSDRRLVSQRFIKKLIDSHGSAETRSPLCRGPATLLM